jgi:ATP-dependent protease ClpP protease subunit
MKPEIKIYGSIGGDDSDSVTLSSVVRQLSEIPMDTEEIDVRINSDGGSVAQGIGIAKALKQHPARIHTIIEGAAFSIAGYIACSGDRRTIDPEGVFHIHGPRVGVEVGTIAEHESNLQQLQTATNAMATLYSEVTGKPVEEIKRMLETDKFYSAEEAVVEGFATEIGEPIAVAALVDTSKFKIPERFGVMLARKKESIVQSKGNEMKVATAQQLRAEFPDAPAEFILSQQLAEASLDDARAAYVRDLTRSNKELKAKLAKAMEEEEPEPEAMEKDENGLPYSMEEIVANVMEALEVKAMEEESEEMEEEEPEEVEAMEEESKAMQDENGLPEDVVSAVAEKVLAKLQKTKSATGSRRSKRRTRLGTRAIRKPVTTATATATASAKDQIRQLAKAKVDSEKGLSLGEASRLVMKENPHLKERLVAEANG